MITNEEVFEKIESFEQSSKGLIESIAELLRDGKRNRFFIRLLALSLVFDIGLSLGLGFVAYKARDASQKAARATTQVALAKSLTKLNCDSANDTRAAARHVWAFILTEEGKGSVTKAEKDQVAGLKKTILVAYAPHIC